MAGLLDGIDPQTALLLGLGSGLLGTSGNGRRASFGEALANGMQAGTAGYRQAIGDRQRAQQIAAEQAAREQQMQLAREQMRIAQQDAAQRGEMFGLQKQEHQLKIDDRSAVQRRAAMKADYMNRVAAGELQLNPQQAFNAGLTLDEIKALTESKDWGRAQVQETRQIRLPDGRVVDQPYDKFGQPVGDPRTPFIKPEMLDLGGKRVAVDLTQVTPGQEFGKTMTPGEVASNDIARGQLGVSRANLGLAGQRLALDRQQAQQGIGAMVFNPEVGGYIPKTLGQGQTPTVVPVPGYEGKIGAAGQRASDAKEVIGLLKQAAPLINSATGSYLGQAYDMGAQAFGVATKGATYAAKLKALEGNLVAKMPKMSGPQSDKDVLLYKQMAGQIGDPSVPAPIKKAAMQTIAEIAARNSGEQFTLDESMFSGQSASGQIKPAAAPGRVLRFDAQGNMIGN